MKEEHWNHPRLSEQALRIADGSRPLPIYTAVAHEHKRFRWCEFTPYEIGFAQDLNLFVPSWAFGRHFTQGVSTDFAVEPSLSLLQGCWGSAFCATVDQMMHEVQSVDGKPEPTVQKLLHQLIYEKLEWQEDRLISPAKFPNPAFSAAQLGADHPWQRMATLKLMDAGVHTNLPFPPLLRKERETDLILAFDQSSSPDILSSVSISVAESFSRSEGLGFPDCTDALSPAEGSTEKRKLTKMNGQKCTVVKGDLAKGVPWIIYMPLLKCDLYSKDFCPRLNGASKEGGYCSTFNFKYTEQNVMELSGLTEHNVKESLKTIKTVITEITAERLKLNQAKASGLAPATGSNGKQ